MKRIILILFIAVLGTGTSYSQDLLQAEFLNLVGGGDVNVTGPTLGAGFSPAGFLATDSVRLLIDVSLANPREDDRNLAGTTEDIFLFIFEGGGSINTTGDPLPAAQLTRLDGDVYYIDIDLGSGELFSSDVIADGGVARFLIKATTFEAGQSGDIQIDFSSVEIPEAAVFTLPTEFTADDNVTIFLNSDLAFGNDRSTTGELTGATDVFMWSGANNFALQPAGQDDFSMAFEDGRLEPLSDNIFRISINPRTYYGLSDDVVVTNIALLFKNTDGSLSARPDNGDFVIDVTQPPSQEIPELAFKIFPESFTADDIVTITFDAKVADDDGNTALLAETDVYLFAGARVSESGDGFERTPDGQVFDVAVGPGLMRPLGDHVFSLTIVPRSYFGLGEDEEVFDLSILFRSPEGDAQTTPNFVVAADECPRSN